MSRTISISGVPKWLLQYLVAGLAVFMALVPVSLSFGPFLGTLGVSAPVLNGATAFTLLTVLWLGLTVLWVRSARRWEGSSSTWWGPIPAEQYGGRFAEAGGIARQNWEQAVERLPDSDEKVD